MLAIFIDIKADFNKKKKVNLFSKARVSLLNKDVWPQFEVNLKSCDIGYCFSLKAHRQTYRYLVGNAAYVATNDNFE